MIKARDGIIEHGTCSCSCVKIKVYCCYWFSKWLKTFQLNENLNWDCTNMITRINCLHKCVHNMWTYWFPMPAGKFPVNKIINQLYDYSIRVSTTDRIWDKQRFQILRFSNPKSQKFSKIRKFQEIDLIIEQILYLAWLLNTQICLWILNLRQDLPNLESREYVADPLYSIVNVHVSLYTCQSSLWNFLCMPQCEHSVDELL